MAAVAAVGGILCAGVSAFDPVPFPTAFCYVPVLIFVPPPPKPLRVPTSIRIEQAHNGANRDCYSSFRDRSTGSVAQREILYGVYDQNGDFMDSVVIREMLTIVSGRGCPRGTTQAGNQCIGEYGPQGGYFRDSLAESPSFGPVTYTQTFQVTTLPSISGYQGVFNLTLNILNNYGPPQSNTLVLGPDVITVNGNNGGFVPCNGGNP